MWGADHLQLLSGNHNRVLKRATPLRICIFLFVLSLCILEVLNCVAQSVSSPRRQYGVRNVSDPCIASLNVSSHTSVKPPSETASSCSSPSTSRLFSLSTHGLLPVILLTVHPATMRFTALRTLRPHQTATKAACTAAAMLDQAAEAVETAAMLEGCHKRETQGRLSRWEGPRLAGLACSELVSAYSSR